MKILLTGEPGVGKSTLLNSIISVFEQKQGFVTNEIRAADGRTGFTMIGSNGKSFVLSSVDSPSEVRVSRYGVNVDALDEFVRNLPTAVENGKLIYMDEIGQMQLLSNVYKKLISTYISTADTLIGTLSKIYHDDFTDTLRSRDDIEIIEVTPQNRDRLKNELIARFAQRVH